MNAWASYTPPMAQVTTVGPTQLMAINTSYFSNASSITFTLPATCPVGAQFEVKGRAASTWIITPAVGQQLIAFGEVMDPSYAGANGAIVDLKCLSDTQVLVTNLFGLAGQLGP